MCSTITCHSLHLLDSRTKSQKQLPCVKTGKTAIWMEPATFIKILPSTNVISTKTWVIPSKPGCVQKVPSWSLSTVPLVKTLLFIIPKEYHTIYKQSSATLSCSPYISICSSSDATLPLIHHWQTSYQAQKEKEHAGHWKLCTQPANIANMSSKVHSQIHTSQQHFRLVNLTAKEEKRA